MKKTIFLCSLATLALASCSSDDEVQGTSERHIEFRSFVDKNVRGASYTAGDNTLDAFKVTCWSSANTANPYFNNVIFTKTTSSSIAPTTCYRSGDDYFYPTDATTTLKFWCVAPTSVITTDGKTLTNYQPDGTIGNQKDVVVAVKPGVTKADKETGTSLEFRHVLSQIEVQVKNESALYEYTVYGVRVGKVYGTSTFNMSTLDHTDRTSALAQSLWTNSNTKTTYEATYNTGIQANATPQSVMATRSTDAAGNNVYSTSDNALLIPQKLTAWAPTNAPDSNIGGNSYLSVKICGRSLSDGKVFYPFNATSNTPSASNSAWTAVGIDTNWEPGKKYVYILDFTHGAGRVDPDDPNKPGEEILGKPIRFTVHTTEWTDGGTITEQIK